MPFRPCSPDSEVRRYGSSGSEARRYGVGRATPRWITLGALAAAIGVGVLWGCAAGGAGGGLAASFAYPPAPQPPRVIALGTLHAGRAPTESETALSQFLFGVELAPTPSVLNPRAMAASDDGLLICDATRSMLMRWDRASNTVRQVPTAEPVVDPVAVCALPDGGCLLAQRTGLVRLSASGAVLMRYRLGGEELKPAGVLAVGDEVWVTDVGKHCIEVFARDSGAPLRRIGQRGRGPGELSMPRGMARASDGNVCVVDMLNCRVQVFAPDGRFVRSIGQAGDMAGSFGRPHDVAVGPDGTVFVSDAFSQRIHAFDASGAPLLAFGEPGTGRGALLLPSGIAVLATPPPSADIPAEYAATPKYYVVVAEQVQRPGLRVYAWLGAEERAGTTTAALPPPARWTPPDPNLVAENPHWKPGRCTVCHQTQGDEKPERIPTERVDALCISCHDNVRAPADPHPIGRPANTDVVKTAADWPTFNGNITCLTCHDIVRHCGAAAARPAVNGAALRHYDPQRALDYCANCHPTNLGTRFSPHQQRDAQGRIREDACMFCHTRRPEVPADGQRRFQPYLRTETSALCLNCHTRHWDLSRAGHVDRPVPPQIRTWMVTRELLLAGKPLAEAQRLAAEPNRPPARLPLGEDRVTCYTCHNPHYNGLFPPESELGTMAQQPDDRRSALRTDWILLCSECHTR